MQKDSDSMQPSPRETRVAITELHMGQHSAYNWEMKNRAPAVLDFLATVVLQLSKRRKIKSLQCVWHMEMWKGAQPYPICHGLSLVEILYRILQDFLGSYRILQDPTGSCKFTQDPTQDPKWHHVV